MHKIKTINISISDLFDSGFRNRNKGHFSAIVRVALSDGTITTEEKKFLDKLAIKLEISQDDLDKIFNSFYRSDVSNHPEIKGTGLGLSIVKRLCDLLKLEIAVESNLNQGTKFVLNFPLSKLK